MLNVDASVLGVESESPHGAAYAGVHCLAPEMVDELIGPGRTCAMGECQPAALPLFGAAAPLVNSHALLRLGLGGEAPDSLLALGSRRADRFPEGQGCELLGFLARVLGYCLGVWLNPPCRH